MENVLSDRWGKAQAKENRPRRPEVTRAATARGTTRRVRTPCPHDVYPSVAAAEVYAAWSGRTLDITYGGKALAAALALANGEPAVFWLTFDARFADSHPEPS